MKVAFDAIIKNVSIKRTASEDREARLILDFRPDPDVMKVLVDLTNLEQEVHVGIVDDKEGQ